MKSAHQLLLLFAVLVVCGCGGGDRRDAAAARKAAGGGGAIGEGLSTSETNSKPDALTRANYLRLEHLTSERELAEIFGPPQRSERQEDYRQYVWSSGTMKLTARVRNDKVFWYSYPGQHEDEKTRAAADGAARAIMDTLRDYVLKNNNRFPPRLEDWDLADFGKKHPEIVEPMKRGDVVVPWGKSANRLVWAYWRETPQFGGPYMRFDSKPIHKSTPKEFARADAIVLTADTIPDDVVAAGKPDRNEPKTMALQERKGIGAQGFFTAGNLAPLLVTKPGSMDEVAKHLVRNYWHVQVLRMVEKGEIVVRWGRDPKMCVYAYPRRFPQVGDPDGWAIYKGQWAPFERIEEAKKAFAE